MTTTEVAKLSVSGEEARTLLAYIRRFNDACNWLSQQAFEAKTFHWLALQRNYYRQLRTQFNLKSAAAQIVCRKVARAYKNWKQRPKARPVLFKPYGAIPITKHSFKREGRVRFGEFTFVFMARPGVLFLANSEAKLAYSSGKFLLYQPVPRTTSALKSATSWLGVDLGIVNIATDSDGVAYSGKTLNGLRHRHHRLRQKLQAKGTHSAKRLLRKRRLKEGRFAAHVNHRISKSIVQKALGTRRGIALENLKGIRQRITAKKAQRRTMYSWGFWQLRSYIEYKSELAGIECVTVDPRNTSRTCPSCGLVDKKNRRTRDEFLCIGCAFAGPADVIAAENISRAAAERPHATVTCG